jgi:hypothetical protein
MLARIPWRLIGYVLAAVLALVTVVSFISDPFGIRSFFRDRQETRAETAESDASARGLEVEGERALSTRVDTYHTQVVEVRDMTARAETEARSAPDAAQPLAADRAARLARHDDGLCDTRPSVCGAAPAEPS